MKKQPKMSIEGAALRQRAEARLREQAPPAGRTGTEADTQRLVHELQVHQVELELQNEELRQARDLMEAEMDKYSDLYDFAPIGYLTLDREGFICEANLACAGLLGLERSRLVKRRLGLFVAATDLAAYNNFLQQIFASKARESCELSLLPEGKPPVAVRIEAAVAASGQECRAVVRDITERKRAEADRLILSKLESTEILAGGIAHDFNNLLTSILLNLDLAQTLVGGVGESAHCLEQARKAALMARGLTQQLITFAEGGAPVRKPTSLSGVIQESTRLALSGSRVRCELALADDLWLADVDEGQIGQVIRSLVLNAREAMPEGGVVAIRAENVVLGSQDEPALIPGDYVRISIADEGSGVAREVLPKIFDPYFSTKERGTQKGMGLGLTICHAVIQKHGGAIGVDSAVRVGTTFRIHLPACRRLTSEAKPPVKRLAPRHGKILVMDDDETVRTAVGMWLQRLGHEVELTENGNQAVEVFKQAQGLGRPFDAAILDLTVRGGMGAQETMRALLEIDPEVKAFVMSGYANDAVVLDHQRHGFRGALVKPFDIGKLQEMLAQVLGSGPSSAASP